MIALVAAAGWTALCHGAWAVEAESGSGLASRAAAEPSEPDAFEQPGDVGRIIQQLDSEIASGDPGSALGQAAMRLLERIFAVVPVASGADLAMIQALPAHFKGRAMSASARGDAGAADHFFAVGNLLAALGEHGASAEARGELPVEHDALSSQPGPRSTKNAVLPTLSPQSQPPGGAATPAPQIVVFSSPAAAPRGEMGGGVAENMPLSTATIDLLLKRGEDNLRRHDVIAARLLFQRVADDPSGMGAAGYAKTYDPIYLADAGARYAQADAERATKYYRLAIAFGNLEAPALLSKLERWKAKSASVNITSPN